MTEKEKARAGQLYFSGEEQLTKERAACKDLCFAYNRTLPSKLEERDKLMRRILGKAGKELLIEPVFWCDYGYNIEVGDNFYMNHGGVILDCAPVVFGDYVFVGPNCGFYTAGHPLDVDRRNQYLEFAKPIIVGNNVWIGGGVRVMPGVTIGDNTVIAGGSVVTKDIPSGVVAAGNPCRVMREITPEDALR